MDLGSYYIKYKHKVERIVERFSKDILVVSAATLMSLLALSYSDLKQKIPTLENFEGPSKLEIKLGKEDINKWNNIIEGPDGQLYLMTYDPQNTLLKMVPYNVEK